MSDVPGSAPKRHLWFWFSAGFLLVFVALSLAVPMFSMHPSGEAVVRTRLWQYYAIEIPRALRPWSPLGPATGSSSAVVITALWHLLLSAAGGAAMLGIRWLIGKLRRRPPGAT
jgi:hypothetical protein